MDATLTADYARIEKAIRYLDRERATAPSLAQVAEHVGLSESHFQRMFTRWAGISPTCSATCAKLGAVARSRSR